ncbi:NUDIX hydrolase [Sphingomonas sp. UYP23]
MSPPIPAATLVLFRETGGGAPELLFVERSRAMVFAGGALVFPGGRVDPGDYALASTLDGDPDELAARIAAIRETIEEVGVAVGVSSMTDATLQQLRCALHDGMAFGSVLHDLSLTIDPAALTAFARWLPAHAASRIFDTRFYLARLPERARAAVVDATENVRAFWSSAQAVLDDADASRATIIFPTRRNIERLARFPDFDAAVTDAERHEICTVTPWTETRDGVDHLCIPDDLGYPVTAEPLSAAVRG